MYVMKYFQRKMYLKLINRTYHSPLLHLESIRMGKEEGQKTFIRTGEPKCKRVHELGGSSESSPDVQIDNRENTMEDRGA